MNNLFLIALLCLFISCSNNDNKFHQTAFGSYVPQSDKLRGPASVTSPLNISLFEDFVVLDDYGKQVRYRMDTRVWIDKDRVYLRKKLKTVLQKTIHDVLADMNNVQKVKEQEKTFSVGSLKDHLIGHLITEFVKTIYVFKIINGTFQFDISIVPLKDSFASFSNELSSNQLIHLPTNSLSKEIEQNEMGLPEKIAMISFPPKEDLQFLAGNVSIAFKLMDFDLNPLSPIPNPKKNAIKGQIIYRKYFRKNKTEINVVNGRRVSFESASIKKGKSRFMTVDYLYDFNLKNLSPKLKQVDLFTGVLKGRGHYKTGLLSHIRSFFQKKEKSVKGKWWKIKGDINSRPIDTAFLLDLKKISYLVDDKKFKVVGNLNLLDDFRDKSETESIGRSEDMNKSGGDLINFLGLNQFIVPVVEGEK